MAFALTAAATSAAAQANTGLSRKAESQSRT